MLIAEELLLLSLDPRSGTAVNSSAEPMKPSVTGALLSELALAEAISFDGRRFVATGAPASDPLLQEVLTALSRGKKAKAQLTAADKALGGARHRVVDRLVATGVLDRRRTTFLTPTRHPVLRPEVRDEVLARVSAAAAGDGQIEPRTAVLLALSGPARLLEVVADKPHAHAKRRIEQATELTPVAPVVKKVIQQAQAAVAGAAVAATSAAAVS